MNNKIAIILGTNTQNLTLPTKDAEKVCEILSASDYGYKLIRTLNTESKYGFLEGFEKEIKNSNDDIIFYYSGHGVCNKEGFLEIQLNNGEDTSTRYIAIESIFELIEKYPKRKCLVILDCCNAISSLKSKKYENTDGFKLLCASGTNEKAKQSKKYSLSIFTHFLIQVLEEHKYDITDHNSKILLSRVHKKVTECMSAANETPLPLLFDTRRNEYEIGHFKQAIDSNVVNERLLRLNENLGVFSEYGSKFWRVRVSYTDIEQVNVLQDAIINKLNECYARRLSNYPEDLVKYFDAIQRPEIAYINKAFYTFPFFLTPFRLNFWGVIPYALHRALGILYHTEGVLTEHNKNNKLKKYIIDHIYNPEKRIIRGNLEYWIIPLIDDLISGGGKLYSISGYMFNELIPLMILQSRNTEYQNKILQVGEVIYINDSAYKKAEEKHKTHVIENMIIDELTKTNDYKNKIAIIDLAQKKSMQKIIKTNNLPLDICSLNHDIENVPVGIGFSLRAFEEIKKVQSLWDELQDISLRILRPVEADLKEIGIILIEKDN